MLLSALYDYAKSRNILADTAFEKRPIRWIIPLDRNGRLMGRGLIETDGESKRGKEYPAPKTSRAKDAGGIAEFLADGLTALFGLEPDPEKKLNTKQRRDRDNNNAKKYEDFWLQIKEAAAETNNSSLIAIRTFGENLKNRCPDFLRYGFKAGVENPKERRKWWVLGADGTEKALGPDAFTFQVEGSLPLLEDVVRAYWRRVYQREIEAKTMELKRGICIVTGTEDVPIAATHLPKIKGVPGTQAFGAAIVSFDKPSFTSYGFDQSNNSPVSLEVVAAYCNGLRDLLSKEDHCLVVGSTAVCFWAKKWEGASGFFAKMLRRPDPSSIADFLKAPWAGLDRQEAKFDRFYSVAFSGNGGRIVVRHWMQCTLEEARVNFEKWFRDLEIVSIPKNRAGGKRRNPAGEPIEPLQAEEDKLPPLAVFRLACCTVRDAKDIRPEVPTQLYLAALQGGAPPLLMIKAILQRLEAELQHYGSKVFFNQSRFALLKLILNRNRQGGETMIEPLLFETDDKAYNCGRLLAVLAEIQAKAHDYQLSGPGVAERYFGTASVSPASVFPLLLRLNRHHLDKIRKSGRNARSQEAHLQAILCKFAPDEVGGAPQFPRHLDLKAQGRFAIGFYQQKAETEKKKEEAISKRSGGEKDIPSEQK